MKYILSLIVSGALVVSGFGQTRNVLVGTNNAVVQPTNFWSADASNAKVGLGLGTTNIVEFGQIYSDDFGILNGAIYFGGQLKYEPETQTFQGDVFLNNGSLTISGTNAATKIASTRTNLGLPWTGLTNSDASSFRTALGLGTAATNSTTAFQPSSATLSNLATGNGSGLTNLAISNITGTIPIASGGTGATNVTNARNNLGATAVGTLLFTAINEAAARTAIGATTVGNNIFTLSVPLGSTNFLRLNADNTVSAISASDFRSSLSLGTAATNPASAFQPSSLALSNLASNNGINLTNIPLSGVVGALATNGNGAGLTNLTAANITGTVALTNGGTGATSAATARTNLGLGWSALTNTDATNFRNAIGLGATNDVAFNSVQIEQDASSVVFSLNIGQTNTGFRGIGGGSSDFGFYRDGSLVWRASGTGFGVSVTSSFSQTIQLNYGAGNFGSISFGGTDAATGAAISRTNLGLPWSGLTNTNAATFQAALFGANTNPVLVDTNGEVVSPTNFWQAAPIATTLQNSAPNATNTAATNARLLFLFSLVPTTTGVTNTVTLPTNGSTFNGDVATITHNGGSNTVTAIRQLGATNNIITLNQPAESVRFLYRDNQWELMDNISYIGPIYFSGTNAAANAAASRTNLGLNDSYEPVYLNLTVTEAAGTNGNVQFTADGIGFDTETARAQYRNSLGIPLAALTNTNNANFQAAVFVTNTTPAAGTNLGDAVAWMEVTVSTNGTNSSFRIPLFK